jgi:hypothetical protein
MVIKLGSTAISNIKLNNIDTKIYVGASLIKAIGPDPIVDTLIPWTPAMVAVNELYEASSSASLLSTSGTQAVSGDPIAQWSDTSGSGRHLTPPTATASDKPLLGAIGDAIGGVLPVLFRDPTALRTAAFGTAYTNHTDFLLVRFKAITTAAVQRYALGLGDASTGNNYMLLQSSTTLGQMRSMTTDTIETNTTERLRLVTMERNTAYEPSTVTPCQTRLNGGGTLFQGTGADNSTLFASGYHVLGNKYVGRATGSGALMDCFAFASSFQALSDGNKQRMEGYLAWNNGGAAMATAVLAADHPYRNARPMVPVGTTSTLGWFDFNPQDVRQTYEGGYIELQADSFAGGTTIPAIDSTTDLWGFPVSLQSSEITRIKTDLLPGGTGIKYIRFPVGFGYRGYRNIDASTGLAKNVGERFPGQNAALTVLLAGIVSLGGGICPEYWSPAPYWKTTGTYGSGTLWAGGSYSRTTTLISIRTSDPTQYAAQIALLTDAFINDLEYFHTNIAPVRMFGLQNEPDPTIQQNYGTCYYDATLNIDVWKVLIPKIRNSATLSTYGGTANTVKLHNNSYDGIGTTILNDTTVLSTGKTVRQEMWGQTLHKIEQISASADWIRDNGNAIWNDDKRMNTWNNEIEDFNPGNSTDAFRFGNFVLNMLHNLDTFHSVVVMPIIHLFKQLGQTSATSSTLGYALAKVRLPAPYGEDPTTPGDEAPTVGYGQYTPVAPNYNAAKSVFDNLPWGSTIIKARSYAWQRKTNVVAFIRPDGKRGLLVVNASTAAVQFDIGVGATAKVMRGKAYSATVLATDLGLVTSTDIRRLIPAGQAEVWIEQ